MKKFTIKGVLDGFRSSVPQPAKPDQEIIENLRPEHFQVKKVSTEEFVLVSLSLLPPATPSPPLALIKVDLSITRRPRRIFRRPSQTRGKTVKDGHANRTSISGYRAE